MKFYRYYEHVYSVGFNGYYFSFMLEEWYLVRETPCGYWISPYPENYHSYDYAMQENKWVSKTARKRFAYPTIEEAWNGYKHRKRSQLRHLKNQYNKIQDLWREIKSMDQAPNEQFTTSGREFFGSNIFKKESANE